MYIHTVAKGFATMALVVAFAGTALASGEHVAPIKELVAGELTKAMANPIVIESIKAQNAKHVSLSQDSIVSLDKKWRAETGAGKGPTIDPVLNNPLSEYLRSLKDKGEGLYSEIFVMDNKGLNVGASDMTSDYWQGDESKFKKSFGTSPEGLFVDKVEKDESTQALQSQVSFTIVDPKSGAAIGAVTFGINVSAL